MIDFLFQRRNVNYALFYIFHINNIKFLLYIIFSWPTFESTVVKENMCTKFFAHWSSYKFIFFDHIITIADNVKQNQ